MQKREKSPWAEVVRKGFMEVKIGLGVSGRNGKTSISRQERGKYSGLREIT